jgi:membrane protein insertase Oxa1/YidC/SpoIIIJ
MALIRCPECRKEISSNAVSCPSCGNPINNSNNSNNKAYEKAIQLYLNNDYHIVQQNDNSTILLSSRYSKLAKYLQISGNIGSGISNMFGNIKDNINNASNVSSSFNVHNTKQAQYQVAIRITKTGELKITGYTLDKLEKDNKQQKKMKKMFYIILLLIIVGFAFIFPFIIQLINRL